MHGWSKVVCYLIMPLQWCGLEAYQQGVTVTTYFWWKWEKTLKVSVWKEGQGHVFHLLIGAWNLDIVGCWSLFIFLLFIFALFNNEVHTMHDNHDDNGRWITSMKKTIGKKTFKPYKYLSIFNMNCYSPTITGIMITPIKSLFCPSLLSLHPLCQAYRQVYHYHTGTDVWPRYQVFFKIVRLKKTIMFYDDYFNDKEQTNTKSLQTGSLLINI